VIRVGGELDLGTVPTLEQELEAAMDRPTGGVVVDLSDSRVHRLDRHRRPGRAMGGDNGSARLKFVPSRAQGVIRVLDMTGVSERMELAEGVVR